MKKKTENKLFDDLDPEIEKFVNRSVEISDRIEEILKSKNITQREFAEMLGKSESEISKWLCGTHNFTIKSIAKIETVLNEDILNYNKPMIFNELNSILNQWIVSINSKNFFELNKNIISAYSSIVENKINIKMNTDLESNYILKSGKLTTIDNEERKFAA